MSSVPINAELRASETRRSATGCSWGGGGGCGAPPAAGGGLMLPTGVCKSRRCSRAMSSAIAADASSVADARAPDGGGADDDAVAGAVGAVGAETPRDTVDAIDATASSSRAPRTSMNPEEPVVASAPPKSCARISSTQSSSTCKAVDASRRCTCANGVAAATSLAAVRKWSTMTRKPPAAVKRARHDCDAAPLPAAEAAGAVAPPLSRSRAATACMTYSAFHPPLRLAATAEDPLGPREDELASVVSWVHRRCAQSTDAGSARAATTAGDVGSSISVAHVASRSAGVDECVSDDAKTSNSRW